MSRRPKASQYVPKSQRKIARSVYFLREHLGINGLHSINFAEVRALLQLAFPRLRISFVPDSLMQGIEAFANAKAGTIKIRKSWEAALLIGTSRFNWTFAHELGHVFNRHPRKAYRKLDEASVRPADLVFEREAHIFASEFLAPMHLVRHCKSVDDIRGRFNLSPAAASVRFRELHERNREHHRDVLLVRNQIENTLLEARQSGLTVPLSANTEAVAVAIVAGAKVLALTFVSVGRTHGHEDYLDAATLAISYATVSPVRFRSQPGRSSALNALNTKGALKILAAKLELDVAAIASAMQDELVIGAFSYLRPYTDQMCEIISNGRGRQNIDHFPSHAKYDVQYDICWDEVDRIQKICELLRIADVSSDSFPDYLNLLRR